MKVSEIDDGGSFERLVREADAASNGDENLKLTLLTERIIGDLCNKKVDEGAAAQHHDVLDFVVPKRTRSGPCSRSEPPQLNHQNKKSCFDQMIKTNNTVQEPKKMMSEKRKITKAEQEPKKQQRKKRKITKAKKEAQVIRVMPERFKNKIEEMGGSKIVLVIQKELTQSDLTKNKNRLAIPLHQIANEFLEPEEKERVVDRGQQMEMVKVIEPCLSRVTEVTLKKWDMDNSYTLNLITTWHKLILSNDANKLQLGSEVQLYAFRRLENDNELCLALVNFDLEDKVVI